MPLALVLALYIGVLVYAALAYFLGPLMPLATIAIGFGLLIIPYLLLEWVATPVVAAYTGFQARWSMLSCLVFGLPLTVLFTVVTPVVSAGDASLAVPVPWLSVVATTKISVLAIIRERLLWWLVLFALAVLAGRLSRHIRPVPKEE